MGALNIHLGLEGVLPLCLYTGWILTVLLSAFWKPMAGVALLTLTLPLQTGRYKLHSLPLGSQFIDLLLLGVIIGLARAGRPVLPRGPMKGFLLALMGFYYLSLWQGAFFMDLPVPAWITDPRFSVWKNYVELFILGLVVSSVVQSKRDVKLILFLMLVSVLIINRSFYNTVSSRDLSHFSYEVRDEGPMGYAGVNGLAAFQAMFICFLVAMRKCKAELSLRIGIWVVIVSSTYCLLFAFSRGGYIGTVAGLAVIGFIKERKILIMLAVLVIAWQTLLPVSVQERIMMTTENSGQGAQLDHSSAGRVNLWNDALELFRSNPVLGTGFNTYEYMGRYEGFRDTHNYYIKVLVETGAVGTLLFVGLLLRMSYLGFQLHRATTDPFWSSLGLGFVGLMSAITVANLFGDRWLYQQLTGYLWVLLGCVLSGLSLVREEQSAPVEGKEETEAPVTLEGATLPALQAN